MVNHFDPGTFTPKGPAGTCAGGCDNCRGRAAGTLVEKDLSRETGMLLAVLSVLGGYYGLGKSLLILRGSKSKDMKPHWLELRHTDGTRLHGAGVNHSEEWWKGMAEIAMAQGLAAMETRGGDGGGGGGGGRSRSYTVLVATPAGQEFLRSPRPLVAALTSAMMAEELVARAAEAAAAQRGQEQEAKQGEEAKLVKRLREVRQRLAERDDQAPENVVSDAALQEIARKRPDSAPHLQSCEGCGAAFIQHYGQVFVDAVLEFCGGSATLTAGAAWRTARPASGGSVHPDPAVAALLSEPKAAAMDAHARFSANQTLTTIATTGRPKPINPMSVAGYLADAAGAGAALHWARLAAECALTEEAARRVASTIRERGADGLGAVKRTLPEYEYGQIKVVAAMMRCGVMWFEPDNQRSAVPAEEPAAKRARTLEGGGGDGEAEPTPAPAIDPAAVLGWLQSNGPASGAALEQRFCRADGVEARRRLSSVLSGLVVDLAVYRRGGSAGTIGSVDLEDAHTLYTPF